MYVSMWEGMKACINMNINEYMHRHMNEQDFPENERHYFTNHVHAFPIVMPVLSVQGISAAVTPILWTIGTPCACRRSAGG